MLAKAGERMPLACTSLPSPISTHKSQLTLSRPTTDRYKKMVYDFLANWCGRQFVDDLPENSYRQSRYPSPPYDATTPPRRPPTAYTAPT